MYALMGMKHFFLLVYNFIVVESQCLYLEGIFVLVEDGALFLSVARLLSFLLFLFLETPKVVQESCSTSIHIFSVNIFTTACVLSRVWLFSTPWTVACQAPLSMGFSRQEHWSELPFTIPGISINTRWENACRCVLRLSQRPNSGEPLEFLFVFIGSSLDPSRSTLWQDSLLSISCEVEINEGNG